MKRCTKCGKLKPESDFYKDKRQNSGLSCWCKSCKTEDHYRIYGKGKFRKKQVVSKTEITTNALDGYKISILKYAKPGECKFTIVSTSGKSYGTNDKTKFLNKITELING